MLGTVLQKKKPYLVVELKVEEWSTREPVESKTEAKPPLFILDHLGW